MLRLIAAAFSDGLAFVREDKKILLIRPPYKRAGSSVVSEGIAEKAVTQYGFTATENEFINWTELIEFLRDKIVAQQIAAGHEIPARGVANGLLQHLPEESIVRLLDRVENELIPGGEYEAAIDFTSSIGALEIWMQNHKICKRVNKILLRCIQLKENMEKRRNELYREVEIGDYSSVFPLSAIKYNPEVIMNLSESVSKRGQVLSTS
jgi:hypothetical protein